MTGVVQLGLESLAVARWTRAALLGKAPAENVDAGPGVQTPSPKLSAFARG